MRSDASSNSHVVFVAAAGAHPDQARSWGPRAWAAGAEHGGALRRPRRAAGAKHGGALRRPRASAAVRQGRVRPICRTLARIVPAVLRGGHVLVGHAHTVGASKQHRAIHHKVRVQSVPGVDARVQDLALQYDEDHGQLRRVSFAVEHEQRRCGQDGRRLDPRAVFGAIPHRPVRRTWHAHGQQPPLLHLQLGGYVRRQREDDEAVQLKL